MIAKMVSYRFYCDEDRCLVAATRGSYDHLPPGWGAVGGLHFCHHHAEDYEGIMDDRVERSDTPETQSPTGSKGEK